MSVKLICQTTVSETVWQVVIVSWGAYTVGPMTRRLSATEVSDEARASLAPHRPAPQGGGRPWVHVGWERMKARGDILRSGWAWRRPQARPPGQTVDQYCRRGRVTGVGAQPHTALREGARMKAGRHPQPSAARLAGQAVKTTGVGGVWG
jgi:putative transposase